MAAERKISSREIYAGRLIKVRVDDVKMDSGRVAVREVVEHHNAVGVLALTKRDRLLLVRQYRYAAGEETLEICAGLVEKGENVKDAAVREMREELGCQAASLYEIGSFFASPGFCTELLTLFLATDLSAAPLPQDEDENVSVVEVRFDDLPVMMARGIFRDSKTFAALAWFMAFRGMKAEFAAYGAGC